MQVTVRLARGMEVDGRSLSASLGTAMIPFSAGFQLDGQSAGAACGDDDQMDSNHPIIRMVNTSGNIF